MKLLTRLILVLLSGSLLPVIRGSLFWRRADYFWLSGLRLFIVLCCLGLASITQAQGTDKEPPMPKTCSRLEGTKPLQMLVLGDSIMWGQGLKEKNKFSYLVQDWLCQRTKRQVIVRREAHSGATITAPEGTCPSAGGEVNISEPTILKQVENATRFYGDGSKVDLVLVDGCINDIDVRNVIDPDITKETLAEIISSKCGEPNRVLLDRVTQAFPKAWIIVTSYYPIMTDRSAKNVLSEGLIEFFKQSKLSLDLLRSDKEKFKEKFKYLVELSSLWQLKASEYILKSVGTVNQGLLNKGEEARVWYIDGPGFGPLNGFSAPQSLLWTHYFNSTGLASLLKVVTVITLGLVNFFPNDDVLFDRAKSCLDAFNSCGADFSRVKCIYASFGHPNRKGARRYADGIIRRMEYLLTHRGWLREGES